MDVTPSNKMFEAMSKFVDSMCGQEPSVLEVTQAAQERRAKRLMVFEFLHMLVAVSMREGVNRKVREIIDRGRGPRDMADRNAAAKAADDAAAGKTQIVMPDGHQSKH